MVAVGYDTKDRTIPLEMGQCSTIHRTTVRAVEDEIRHNRCRNTNTVVAIDTTGVEVFCLECVLVEDDDSFPCFNMSCTNRRMILDNNV